MQNDVFVPLYNIVLQTYVSTKVTIIIAGVLTGATLLVCLVGAFYTVTSMINIKDATENAIIDSVDNDIITAKRSAPASNDPSMQRNMSFGNNIYCRVNTLTDHAGKRIRSISITHNSIGEIPNKTENYS